MQNLGNEASGMEAIIPLLWLFVVMGAVLLSAVKNRMNERMTKRIGLEMEVIKTAHAYEAPHQKLATWLTKKSIEWQKAQSKPDGFFKRLAFRFMGYTHEVMNDTTKLVTDSSLSRGGIEVVSPVLEGDHDTNSWIEQVAYGLKGVAKIDSSTGLHLHIGLRAANNDWRTHESFVGGLSSDSEMRHGYYRAKAVLGAVILTVGKWQDVYYKMVAPSRRNGQWSKSVARVWERGFVTKYFDELKESGYDAEKHMRFLCKVADLFINTGDRYYCVNSQAFERYGTIEFRSHQGTKNARKIRNWVDMHYLLVQRCTNESWLDIVHYDGKSITDFFGFLGISPSDQLFKHQVRRIRKLNATNLNTVFQHDPQLSLDNLFTKADGCTTCGSTTCDHDDECGNTVEIELTNEIAKHFRGNYGWTCDECGEYDIDYLNANGYNVDWYDDHADCYCPNCDSTQSFSMIAGSIMSLMLGVSPMLLLLVGCGIGAIHVARSKFSHRNLAAKLLRGLGDRGKQAAGFAFDRLDDEGKRKVFYLKMAQHPNVVANKIRKEISPKDTTWWMGHTRFATHGSNTDKNAHPHFSRKVMVTLIHNGVVHNYADVWTKLESEPTGEVDSQAVAQCLEEGGIEKVVELCKGSMSLIWNDRRDGVDVLKCWTNGGNPLVMGRLDDAKNGAVVIASTEAILKKAVGKRLKTMWDAAIGREYTIHANGTITKRDIEGSEETAGITYDWRTYYTDHYIPKKKVVKGGKQISRTTVNKSGGATRGDYRSRPPQWIINKAKDELASKDGWESRQGWDGWCNKAQMGIKPNGEMYDVPQYVNPTAYTEDIIAILRGDHQGYDPINGDWCNMDWSGDYRFYN